MRVLIPIVMLPLAACNHADDARRALAKRVIVEHCGACHTIPGVAKAAGKVGPDLAGIGQRQVLAGKLPNNRPNMILWITHAQSVSPGSVMPDIPLAPHEAGVVADYLYSLD